LDVNGLESGLTLCEGDICWVALIFGLVKLGYISYYRAGSNELMKRYCLSEVIKPDEGAMLLLRGKLCRANPISAKGMKQGLRMIRGVNH
jgi:hypothetical protein